jgi:subfamily B ATP-binding cassette protein MsbA
VLFAGLVALLWGLNLTVAVPIVKILLEQQPLDEYIDEKATVAKEEIATRTAAVTYLDKELDRLQGDRTEWGADERAQLLKKHSRQQSKISDASRRLRVLNWVKSHVIAHLPTDAFNLLSVIFLLLMLATILKGLCIVVQEVVVGSMVELTAMGIRKDCFRHLLSLDYQTLTTLGTAQLLSHFTNDMHALANGLKMIGGKMVREPLKALVCVIFAFWICWQLALLTFLLAPLVALVFYRIGRKLKQASHRVLESMSRIYKTLEETFDGTKVVIAFHAARRHRQRFHYESKEYFKKALKITKIDALTSPTAEVLAFLAAFMGLLPGCYLVLRGTTEIWGIRLSTGQLEVTELVFLYMALAGIIDPARKLSTTYAKLKRASAAADRIFGLLDLKPLVKQPTAPSAMPLHEKSIEFRNVDFAYASHDEGNRLRPAALVDANLTVAAGDVIALVGGNGSGKSTLVNLLPRYFDPDRGAVLIDGVDVRDARLGDLRGQIGVVTQETWLFDDTIYENIRYGKSDATRGEIEKAARQAHVTQFLDQLPDGFETQVGEKGQRLSGGQRQRIALARAILRDPTILILDEATSAIDSQSELLIHEALRRFVVGRTTFLITHTVSPSILELVTRIVVMDRGRLIATGPHDELVKNCAEYQRLYQAQHQPTTDDSSDEPDSHIELDQSHRADGRAIDPSEPPAKTADPHAPADTATGNDSQFESSDDAELDAPNILPLRPHVTNRFDVVRADEEEDDEPAHSPPDAGIPRSTEGETTGRKSSGDDDNPTPTGTHG